MPSQLLPISNEEKKWVENLTSDRGWIYHFSRGCIRHAISEMVGIHPLKVPLKAEPGKPPLLANGWGYISLSHCKDALLIGWSPRRIGVDIERSDREFKAELLAKSICKEQLSIEEEQILNEFNLERFNRDKGRHL